ncbi:hypothetical protein CRUP_001292 [Coryphaenoides rupestris]|nr:hypothetical protein CRUP_001292 [Coryphaenoides rupestris]
MAHKGRSRAEPLFWTDEEVELLLRVTLNYKKHKTQENTDWESCQSKYSDILEAFRHHYPSSAGEKFPQDKHSISKLQVTTKLKAIRYKYRLALHSGRQTGHGRVILIFFDLCKNIWSGSPGGSSPGVVDSSPRPPAPDSPGTSDATARSLPPPVVRQRRCSTRVGVSLSTPMLTFAGPRNAKLNRYRRDMRKKRVPAKTATQKDLQIDRILDLMEASDRRNAEYLQQITSNVATITNAIQEGLSLLDYFMLQQPSMPPHFAYPQGSSEYTHMQAPLPPSPGLQQAHTHPGTPTPTPTSQTHVVPFEGGEEVSTADNQYGMKREEEERQEPPMGIEIKEEPLGEEEGYNPVGQKESQTSIDWG